METVADGADPSQGGEKITDGEGGPVQPSQPFAEKTKSFATHLLPDSGATRAHGGALAAGGLGAQPAPTTRQQPNVVATLADLRVLWGGRDRLLKVTEVAEQLAVGAWRIYQLFESGELPHVRMNNSIRIRPSDLQEFIASRVTTPEKRRPHRRKQPTD